MNIRIQKIFLFLLCLSPMLLLGQTFPGAGIPQPIPATGTGGGPCVGGPSESIATVAGTGIIGTDVAIVDVTVDLFHTFPGDMDISLIAPDGTTWDLSSDNGGAGLPGADPGDGYRNTVFADGNPSITGGAAPFTGSFQAEMGAFATGFDGIAADGDWTLSICDDFSGDSGTMLAYSITFAPLCSITSVPAGPIVVDNDPGVCGANVSFAFVAPDCLDPVTNDFAGDEDAADDMVSGLFPVGNTIVTLTSGATTLEVEVIVNDTEGPVVNCPANQTINLAPGACTAIFNVDLGATDNCGIAGVPAGDPIPTPGVFGGLESCLGQGFSIACTGGLSSQVQELSTAGLPADFLITEGCFIWDNTSWGANSGIVNFYSAPVGANPPPTYRTATPVATSGVVNLGGLGLVPGEAVCLPMTTPFQLSAGDGLYMEVMSNAVGGISFNGAECNGIVADGTNTFLESDLCGSGFLSDFGFTVDAFFAFTAQGIQFQTPDADNEFALGDELPIGTTDFGFTVTDVNGNETECSFSVTVEEFANPISSLACNDAVNISVDENCEITLSADIFLEGGPYGCYDNYEINIWPFGNEAAAIGPFTGSPSVALPTGTHIAEVVDPNTGIACWGEFTVEDKSAPSLECSNYTVNCLNEDAVPGSPSVATASIEIGTIGSQDATVLEEDFNVVADPTLNSVTSGELTLTSTHTWVGDLVVNVTAPNGATVELVNNIGGPGFGCAGNGLDLVFTDAGDAYSVLDGTCGNLPAVAGTFQPRTGSIDALFAGGYVGQWTVSVEDLAFGDGGDVEIGMNLVGFGEVPLPIPAGATAQSVGGGSYIVNGLDACGAATISYTDSYDANDCADGRIIRTWIVQDASGNVGTGCTDTITVERLGISGILLPPSLVELGCGGGTDPMDIENAFDNPLTTDISLSANCTLDVVERNEGTPFAYPHYMVAGCDGNMHPQAVDNNVCNIYATYTDQVIPACGPGCDGNVKVIRTWTLLDWCTNEQANFTQLIKAVDNVGPTFNVLDVTVSTDPWGCAADVSIPQPWELHDDCTSVVDYTISGPAGVVIVGDSEGGYVALDAPKGIHTFTYTASDCCGNVTAKDITVTINDGAAPVVVVKQNIVISLTSSSTNNTGIAKLFAESVDNGSHDGCTDIKLEVRRDSDNCDVRGNDTYNADGHPQDGSPNPSSPSFDPDGGAYVKFCCADITAATVDVDNDGENDPGYVKVWLRVWDDGDMNGVFGSAGDNYNESWAYVKVEDKLAPAITCPADVTLTCDMDYTDLSMTGEAQGYASCGGIGTEYNDIIINLNSCNEGFVRRRWNIIGRSDIFCDQTITLEGIDAPVNVSFNQVGDFTAANCPDMIALGEPTWTAGPCDVLGYTLETDTFRFEDGACYKLVNHWTVINWCDYEPNNPLWDGSGIWEHIQVIKVTDETKPVIEDCEDKMFAVNDSADSDNDGDVCEAKITLTNVATDPGSDNCPTGWLKWQVIVDLWADGTPDLEYSSFLPPFDNNLGNDTNGNGINDRYLMPTANGETVSVALPDVPGSMSNHKVTWKVTDGCNNVTTCGYDFMIVDKKAPTPYCVDLSTAVMEMGANGPGVDLWAIDFNVGSFDNCTAEGNLRYTFTDVAPENDPLYSAADRSSSKTFTCDDVENSPVEVNMYVWDEKGNADFCVVFLTIVDNQGLCGNGSRPDVAGTINTEEGVAVSNVNTSMVAAISEYPKSDMSDEDGYYAFMQNPENVDYVLEGNKDVDYLNGVTTLDLVKIQRHLLGLESLDSPYKLIAADINADNDLRANDLTELRKLILGVITDLPTNDSWRFVNADQALTMDLDYATVDYSIELNNLTADAMNSNFVGVKVGDVTNNAVSNLQDQTVEVRSAKNLEFVIDNNAVTAGETVAVTFTSNDFAEVFGYQFTMELNGLEFANVQGGAVSMTDANVGVLNNNVVTVSYNNGTAITASASEAVFTANFVATKDGNISEMIDLTSKVAGAEAYVGESLEVRGVTISTRGDVVVSDVTELFQNEPNPFKEQTVVSFNLAEASAATLTVFDVTGKLLQVTNIDGVRGYNSVTLESNQLGTSGVLYYTLTSGEFTATKSMIIIK